MRALKGLGLGIAEGAALLLLISAMQACSGCASAQVKRGAYDTLNTTEAVLEAAQQFEISIKCGAPSAPEPPACVPEATHKRIQADFLQAGEYGREITGLARSASSGAPLPQKALDLALKMKTLVEKILSELPKSDKTQALKAQLAGG